MENIFGCIDDEYYTCIGYNNGKYTLVEDKDYYSHDDKYYKEERIDKIQVTEQELISKYIDKTINIVEHDNKKVLVDISNIDWIKLGSYRKMKHIRGLLEPLKEIKNGYNAELIKRLLEGIFNTYLYDCWCIANTDIELCTATDVALLHSGKHPDYSSYSEKEWGIPSISHVCNIDDFLKQCERVDKILSNKIDYSPDLGTIEIYRAPYYYYYYEYEDYTKISEHALRQIYEVLDNVDIDAMCKGFIDIYKVFIAYAIYVYTNSDKYKELIETIESGVGYAGGNMNINTGYGDIILHIKYSLGSMTKEEMLKLGKIVRYIGQKDAKTSQFKCIQKFRDRNSVIIGYRIQDKNGNIRYIDSKVLKDMMRQNKISISNLTLTKDNRIISNNNI